MIVSTSTLKDTKNLMDMVHCLRCNKPDKQYIGEAKRRHKKTAIMNTDDQ